MSLSTEVEAFLDQINGANLPPLADLGVDAARLGYAALTATPGPDVERVHEEIVSTGEHGPFTVRCYHPKGAHEPSGVLVWVHGGGFVVGDLETADSTCRTLANEAQIVVVSVDYHLAPEHPFPSAIDDVMAALKWVVDHADDLNVDSAKLAVGGDSAGGNLSAVAAQLSHAGAGPKIAFQLLVYPVVDLEGTYASRDENGEGFFLTNENMVWFVSQYLSGRDPSSPRVSPILAADLSGLASAMVITAQFDPLRDEGIAYVNALRSAGVEVEHAHFDGEIHGFFDFDFLPDCAVARSGAAAAIVNAFAPHSSTSS